MAHAALTRLCTGEARTLEGVSGGETASSCAGWAGKAGTACGCVPLGSGRGGARPALSRERDAGWKLLRCTTDDICSSDSNWGGAASTHRVVLQATR